jgi:hypothetical protein
VASEDVAEFGGWPRPPRWVWAAAGVAAVAVLTGLAAARSGPHDAASSRTRSRTLAAGAPAVWPSAAGACGSAAYLPLLHVDGYRAAVGAALVVGGTAVRQVTPGVVVSRPLAGLPGHGRLVTSLVAGPRGDYALDAPCGSSRGYLRVYRIVAGGAHPLGITADALLAGPQHAWAVTYLAQYTLLAPELTPLDGGRAAVLKTQTDPVADTAAGLVVVAYHERAGAPGTVELLDANTGALVRRLAEGSAIGAAGGVVLVGLPGCAAPAAHRTCTLESIDLTTGRPVAAFPLPAGRVPVSGAVFSPGGTSAALQLARARQDPRVTTGVALPPADVAVLHLDTGGLDVVPGLELPPQTQAGLAFGATGRWLFATVSEGGHGELLAWRPGMPGPALVTRLPGPLVGAPPLLRAGYPALPRGLPVPAGRVTCDGACCARR